MQTPSSTSPNRRESDENYFNVVVKVSDRIRIIECHDGIQWIVQKRVSADGATKVQWRGFKYFRSRDALLARLVWLKIDLTADQRLVLEALPAWLPR